VIVRLYRWPSEYWIPDPHSLVQDASVRGVGSSPLVSRASDRTEVVGQPIAAEGSFSVRKLRDEFVAGPVHSSKMNRVCKLCLKFVAQFQNKIVDGPGARIIVKAPHLIQ
jgi:hypothetical protein